MDSNTDSPGEPGAAPASEAGRADGRLEAIRQRSAAVRDQVARRREELEHNRHVGLLLLTRRRFTQIEGGELSVLIALSMFVAMVPVMLLCFSWITGFSSSANLATLIIRHYHLREPVAGIVPRHLRQRRRRPQRRVGARGRQPGWGRGGHVDLRVHPGPGGLAVLAGVALTFVLWLATPHLLLGKDLGGWRGLLPTAVAGTTVTVGFRLLLLLLPRWLRSWAVPFGAIGTSLALLMAVQLLATGWVLVAAFGAVYWERIADTDTIIRTELES